MIRAAQEAIAEFMDKAGQGAPAHPSAPSNAIRLLRVELISEELSELISAQLQGDVVGVADAIADLLYVVIGAAVAWGIDIDPVFTEVHRSNMSKFIDGHIRDDGKLMKGPSYSPAAIAAILEAQMD